MNIRDKIINLDNRDYHMHTSTFSDWLNTLDELVKYAWDIWMKEIAITDHSQIALDRFSNQCKFFRWWNRWALKYWKNVHNDVNVIFWVEWDLLDGDWACCFDIQWKESDFNILSAHKDIFIWDKNKITDAYIRAIEKYHNKISFIWHSCNNKDFWEQVDIEKLVEVANKYDVALEFNAKNLYWWKTNIEKLHILLKKSNKIYINSDAHTLFELKDVRTFAINFLKDNWYI